MFRRLVGCSWKRNGKPKAKRKAENEDGWNFGAKITIILGKKPVSFFSLIR